MEESKKKKKNWIEFLRSRVGKKSERKRYGWESCKGGLIDLWSEMSGLERVEEGWQRVDRKMEEVISITLET